MDQDQIQPQGPSGTRRVTVAIVVALLVMAILALAYWMISQGSKNQLMRKDGQVAVCQVDKDTPFAENTVYVNTSAVDKTLSDSLSYMGPCAEYGKTDTIRGNKFTAYSQTDSDKPYAVGMVLPKESLDNLPMDPVNEGLYCFDKDKNGSIDRAMECSGGYERQMPYSESVTNNKDFPYTYLLLNWNPSGHVPPEVYGVPHFDVHFYMNANEERLAIKAGDCSVMVDCTQAAKEGNVMPDAKYIPSSLKNLGALEPAMGNHLINNDGHEWHKHDFDHTFIYGIWNKQVTYHEPMITLDYLKKVVSGEVESQCYDVPQPKAWQKTGWYPKKYCMEYRENRGELTVSLQDFVLQKAS